MELEHLQERYMSCLRSFVEHSAPQQPNRFHDLLVRLPEVSLTNKEISPGWLVAAWIVYIFTRTVVYDIYKRGLKEGGIETKKRRVEA